jgi:hypothetical protein
MCVQCAATASVVVGSASGLRAWLGSRARSPAARRRLKVVTFALAGLAVAGSSVGFSGT